MMIDLNGLEAYSGTVRGTTKKLDFWRLLFIRIRRMLLASVKLFEQFEFYAAWVKYLDQFLRILALYQACVLIPRFVLNVLYVAQHLSGPTSHNLIARCWEMAYDFGWIMNGVLAVFILVGSLAPLAIYLPIITPTYQLCAHAARFLMDCYYGKNFEDDYTDLMRVVLRMGVSICIISTGLMMLFGSANPAISFLAATLAVVVTLVSKVLTQNLVSDTPHARLNMFASKLDDDTMKPSDVDKTLVSREQSC